MQFLSNLKEAKFFKKLSNSIVQCTACNRCCTIAEGGFGECKVRKNVDGKLYSTVYGQTQTLNIDPIEKKPLFHFKPGTSCLSVSTLGCNFKCGFCQNFEMSQEFNAENVEGPFGFVSPEKIVEFALQKGAPGIAYTYTEPSVFAEYALEAMKIARKKGLYNVWVSNGYFSKELRKEILPFLDAVNIDLKGSEEFYEKICGGIKREKVLENIEWVYRHKVHLELTYLIVPGFNDKEKDFKEAVDFVISLSPKIPLHFSAFHPAFRLSYLPSTSAGKVLEAKSIAEKAGLKFVYAGNIGESENSYCPKCKSLIVKRQNYFTQLAGIKGKKCAKCGFDLSEDFVF